MVAYLSTTESIAVLKGLSDAIDLMGQLRRLIKRLNLYRLMPDPSSHSSNFMTPFSPVHLKCSTLPRSSINSEERILPTSFLLDSRSPTSSPSLFSPL